MFIYIAYLEQLRKLTRRPFCNVWRVLIEYAICTFALAKVHVAAQTMTFLHHSSSATMGVFMLVR